jgi:hypothetical protein
MSKRYPGNFITGNPVALTQTSNNGVWDLKDNYQATSSNTWQEVDGIYEIPRSLRFRKSATNTLSKSFSTAPTSRTTMTFSVWVKRGLPSDGSLYQAMFGTSNNYENFTFNTDDTIRFTGPYSSGQQGIYVTTQKFRDHSSWYHFVLVHDTTNAVATERLRLFVNGSKVTSYSTQTVSNQNNTTTEWLVSGAQSGIGTTGGSGTASLFDGYMAEVNCIDGQALDPSYFGYTDSITGIWCPKKYTGTYGNNGFYILGNTTPETNFANYIGGANSGNYLTAPYSSDFALTNSDFTLEAFVFASEAFTNNDHAIFNFGENVTSVNGKSLILTGYAGGSSPCRTLRIALSSNGSSNDLVNYVDVGNIELYTWNHVAVTRTGGYIYVNINGKRVYSYNIGSTSLYNQTTYGPSIASYRNNGSFGASSSWPGAISNVRFTIGQCLYTGTSFTVPTAPLTTTSQGATSSNVKLLCCQSSTAAVDNSQYARTLTNVGTASFVDYAMSLTDRSGNGNTWGFNNHLVLNLPGNRSTANWDIMVDSPTNVFTTATDIGGVVPGNYCTLNPLDNTATISAGNLSVTRDGTGAHLGTRGTIGITTGKWYWEATYVSAGGVTGSSATGVALSTWNETTYCGDTGSWSYHSNGNKYLNGAAGVAYGATYTTGDIIGVAFDADAGTITFYKNNVSQGQLVSGLISGPYFPAASVYASSAWSFNFGQRAFSYTPPSGYKSLNTTNLQALGTSAVGNAAITPNKWMDASLWGGTGTNVKVTNSGFQPDLVWNKSRTVTENHLLNDSVRGVGMSLYSNLTTAETYDPGLISFNTDGFNSYGTSGYSYVSWQWKQSPTSGFNIVPYAGSAAGAQSITHNLGVAPKMMIIKCRTTATTQAWAVYHSSLGATQYAILNSSAAAATGSTYWNNTAPTSSVFTVGTHNDVNIANSAYTYIAYLWAEVPGFSKFGSYTGNGSADGPFVYTGFRPRFVMIKRRDDAGNWWIHDTARDANNVMSNYLMWDTSAAEAVFANIDCVSNGFKLRLATYQPNTSGGTFIYMAFAESPFGLNNRAR